MRKRKEKAMRADYSKADLGVGVRGKYLRDYYAGSEAERLGSKPAGKAKKTSAASPPRSRKRR